MKVSSEWQVMTPIKGRPVGGERWVNWTIIAIHRREAEKVADQAAGQLGFAWDGDIAVKHVRAVYTEDGE